MGNVKFHNVVEIIKLNTIIDFERIFLHPYLSLLNTVENMFSKQKEITKRGNPVRK